jgi:hypothetical protein
LIPFFDLETSLFSGEKMTEKINFIHIGKTGGTAVRTPLRDFIKTGPELKILLPPHKVGLREAAKKNPDCKVVFFIREPISRFISGFNSRLRKGLPRHFTEWSAAEKAAFKIFKTPNSLAEGLGSWFPSRRRAAEDAMQAMRHTRWGYQYYLGSVQLLERETDRILFIGSQEELNSDFELLKKLLKMGPEYVLPEDPVAAHRAPDDLEKHVSRKGQRNLMKHYQADYKIYEWCKARRLELIAQIESKLGGAS